MANTDRVRAALAEAGHVPAGRSNPGFRIHHVTGTKGDVGVKAVGYKSNAAFHVAYSQTLAHSFPEASTTIEPGLMGGRHVFVRFPETLARGAE